MRRADRLFQIVQHLSGGRLLTAQALAERLEVSRRTVYRDIADLQGTGVPIDGEAGIGYALRSGYQVPPLMFTREEITALVVGARLTKAFGGIALARAAEEALVKIERVLSPELKDSIERVQIHALGFRLDEATRARLDDLSAAVDSRRRTTIRYNSLAGEATARTIRPLGLFFWGQVWTLVAWCELRDDFRTFRVDLIDRAEITGETFRSEPGRTLRDYFQARQS